MKVLVTGAGALLGQGVIRSLSKSSLPLHVIAVDPSPLSAGLYWADEAHIIPMAKDPGHLGQMRELLQKIRPEAVFIGTDVELEIFAEHREEIEQEYKTKIVTVQPLPRPDSCRSVLVGVGFAAVQSSISSA